MTLKNLLGTSLDAVQPDAATVGKLLAAAQRPRELGAAEAREAAGGMAG
jgi:hypothetical protein